METDPDELDGIADDPESPSMTELVEMVRDGQYDVPGLAAQLGLSDGHVTMLLAAVAGESLRQDSESS